MSNEALNGNFAKPMLAPVRVLNLYAGIGGNRMLWGNNFDITAVEYNPNIAKVYSNQFPNDKIIIGDAHQYLLDHYNEFDFIWSSPPCPSHSRINHARTRKPDYPDMRLYAEIISLEQWFKGVYVVENVIPYYEPLIKGPLIDRHLFWTNFKLTSFEPSEKAIIRIDAPVY